MTINEAAEWFGNKAKLADAISVTRQAVNHWRKHGIPPLRQWQIEEITNGELKRDA